MADEIRFVGDPETDGDLTLIAHVFNSAGAQVGGDIALTEAGDTAIYLGDMPTTPAGTYSIRILEGTTLQGDGEMIWDGTAEITALDLAAGQAATIAEVQQTETDVIAALPDVSGLATQASVDTLPDLAAMEASAALTATADVSGLPSLAQIKTANHEALDEAGLVPAKVIDFPGAAGDSATTPHDPSLNPAGDVSFIFDGNLDVWGKGSLQSIGAKYSTGDNERGYNLRISSGGQPNLVWSPDGTAATLINQLFGTFTVPSDGERGRFAVYLDVDNGAGGWTIYWYEWAGTAWVESQTFTGTGVTSVHASTTLLRLGSRTASADMLAGMIRRFEIYDGQAPELGGSGTLAFTANADGAVASATSWVPPSGQTITLEGNAALRGVDRVTEIDAASRYADIIAALPDVSGLPTLVEMEGSSALTAVADVAALASQSSIDALETKAQADTRQAALLAAHTATQTAVAGIPAAVWGHTARTITDKTGFSLDATYQATLVAAVDAAVLSDVDGTSLTQAILTRINTSLDIPGLELAAIGQACRDAIPEIVRLDANVSTRSTPADVATARDAVIAVVPVAAPTEADMYAHFTDANRADAFKASLVGLATSTDVTNTQLALATLIGQLPEASTIAAAVWATVIDGASFTALQGLAFLAGINITLTRTDGGDADELPGTWRMDQHDTDGTTVLRQWNLAINELGLVTSQQVI
ncbi:MAG: hypothetical protein AAGA37_19710 [Actinomycetota bacterium]